MNKFKEKELKNLWGGWNRPIKKKRRKKDMEVLIIKDNKKVIDLNTKRLGSLLKIFLTTITVDTSIIALVKLITILS